MATPKGLKLFVIHHIECTSIEGPDLTRSIIEEAYIGETAYSTLSKAIDAALEHAKENMGHWEAVHANNPMYKSMSGGVPDLLITSSPYTLDDTSYLKHEVSFIMGDTIDSMWRVFELILD